MLTQKTKYAIRGVLYLATTSTEIPTLKSGKDVSKALKIPLAFTGKILQQLARENIILSTKGPGGGFGLSEKNMNVPLYKILEVMDDTSFFTECGLGLSECSEAHPCPIHNTFKKSREDLLQLFKEKTIKDLSDDVRGNLLYLVR